MSRSLFWIFDVLNYKICSLSPAWYIRYLRKQGVRIGEGTIFFGRPFIDLTHPCLVEIGKNCVITHNVTLLTHGFDICVLREKYGESFESTAKVMLEDNVFVGLGSIILKGVRIGKNTIIGAGSVVTHDIPANSVAAGNPCKVIMSLDEYYKKTKVRSAEEIKALASELNRSKGKLP
jgi:acetyltransferase-like isoleucine patch superfamily enzyme